MRDGLFNLSMKVLFLVLLLSSGLKVFSLQNQVGIHDPSSIVKDSDTYWIFGTGDGISTLYSNDLIKWNSGKTPFTKSVYPGWINTYVPKFAGTFWAPECIYMNGKYYLYYACSTWGVNTSCIGLATSPSLNNPVWTDEGVVVFSNTSKTYNTIDPAIFRDLDGKVWFTYGSWFSGIQMQELDSVSGKPKDATIYNVCNFNDPENSHVVINGSYYYLFVNRGLCCKGMNSTYYIQVARSTNPTGPYTDWRTILSTSSTFIGPGALGYFQENGIEWTTYHYYDGNNSGSAKLAVGQMLWQDGWPVITQNWLGNGSYKISNLSNNLVWTNLNCLSDSGTSIVLDTWINYRCQAWNINQLGNGNYNITSGLGDLAAYVSNCQNIGVTLSLSPLYNTSCYSFRIERNNIGNFVISVGNNNLVLKPPTSAPQTNPVYTGVYFGDLNQKWSFTEVILDSTIVAISNPDILPGQFLIYPNPVTDNNFSIIANSPINEHKLKLTLYNLQGVAVFNKNLNIKKYNNVYLNNIEHGIYFIQIQNNNIIYNKKIVIN